MGRHPAPMIPRRVTVNGYVRYEVRVPKDLRPQENATRRYFQKEKIAQSFINRLKSDQRNYSDKAYGLTDAQKIEAFKCFEMLKPYKNASLTVAVQEYLERHRQAARSATLDELLRLFLEAKRKSGGRGSRARTLKDVNERFRRFARAHPGRLASTFTPEEIHDWLMGLNRTTTYGQETGEPVSQQSRRNYYRVLHNVFNFAAEPVRRLVTTNPVSPVKLPGVERKRVSLLTPEETKRLLDAADPALRPYIALCAFAGLRPNQAARMRWEWIHLDRMELEIPMGHDKTHGERIVPIQPNLAKWLEQIPAEERRGKIFHSRDYFTNAYRKAGLAPWQNDVLRHSYASYRLKLLGSFGQLAEEMGNSESVLRTRYVRSLSPAQAAAYFQIVPA